jgi:hypothetical protein
MLPDDLVQALDAYFRAQETPLALNSLLQVALREYLAERGYLRPLNPLHITPAPHGSGHGDISVEHDRYFSES